MYDGSGSSMMVPKPGKVDWRVLVAMGYSEDAVTKAVERCGGDACAAVCVLVREVLRCPIVLRACYARSGTEMSYLTHLLHPTRCPVLRKRMCPCFVVRCPVLREGVAICLRVRYAMSGTEIGPGPPSGRGGRGGRGRRRGPPPSIGSVLYHTGGGLISEHHGMALRMICAVSGTDIAYGATRRRGSAGRAGSYQPTRPLRDVRAVAYGGSHRSPVLTWLKRAYRHAMAGTELSYGAVYIRY
eukprot:1780578-Rhodomonas_salina.2